MGQPAFWLDYPTYHVTLNYSHGEQVRYWITAADGSHPCGLANYYIDNQILPSVLKILKELGYSEDDLKFKGEQKGLSSFF